MPLRLRSCLVTLGLVLTLPSAAQAANVHVDTPGLPPSTPVLVFDAAPGEANVAVVIRLAANSYFVTDVRNPVTNTGGLPLVCSASNLNGLQGYTCAGVTRIALNLGDQADIGVVANTDAAVPATFDGGDGSDTFVGGSEADAFTGGPGTDFVSYSGRTSGVDVTLDGAANDGATAEHDNVGTDVEGVVGGDAGDHLSGSAAPNVLVGGKGDDVISGADGADTLDGGPGGDTISGGGGTDSLSYAKRTAAVSVTEDGRADDGEAGEGDNVAADVEHLTGGPGGDRLVGGAGPNVLDGGGGNDTLAGGLGRDVLSGGADRDRADYSARTEALTLKLDGAPDSGTPGEGDTLSSDIEDVTGGSGNDVIEGSGAANALAGGAGNDSITGLGGDDTFDGGIGNDTLAARDGIAESVGCGAGTDRVISDPADRAAADCEQVDTGVKPPVPPPVPVRDRTAPKLTLSRARATLGSSRLLHLSLACANEPKGCRGTLMLSTTGRRPHTLARVVFRLRDAHRRTITVKLARSAASFLPPGRTTKIRVVASIRDTAGNRAKRTLTLRITKS